MVGSGISEKLANTSTLNIAMCGGQDMTGKFMTDMWYDEIKDYDFGNSGFNGSTSSSDGLSTWGAAITLITVIIATASPMHICFIFSPLVILWRFKFVVNRFFTENFNLRRKQMIHH